MSQQLSEHFSLEELTITSNLSYQVQNRELTLDQVDKLKTLAAHCENIRELCGGKPMRIHSGYRCPELNGSTLGAASTSQHPRCEAVDFDIEGQALSETFDTLIAAAKAGSLKFGQLIIEMAERQYATVAWIHCSVIGTLDPAKVGQVMRMQAGPDGKPHYELVTKFDFGA